jgi:hypothetical protein
MVEEMFASRRPDSHLKISGQSPHSTALKSNARNRSGNAALEKNWHVNNANDDFGFEIRLQRLLPLALLLLLQRQ